MIIRPFLRAVACLLLGVSLATHADTSRLKPFVLADSEYASFVEAVAQTREKLVTAGFTVIGDYTPYDGAQILVFTSPALQDVAVKTELGGFGAVLRAAVTQVNDAIQVSYVNPQYLATAYRLAGELSGVTDQLAAALGAQETFGSKRGIKVKSLAKYNYMLGMEHFDDPYELGGYEDQATAVAAVAAKLQMGANGLSSVYQLALPSGDVLFGVAMQPQAHDDRYYNDSYQMSVVDVADLRSTAYLPYEVLVTNGQVKALHMRFRMAVHFPDLSMMGKHSFMTLMPSPKAINKALTTLVD